MDALIEQNIKYNSETYELVQDNSQYKIGDLVIYYYMPYKIDKVRVKNSYVVYDLKNINGNLDKCSVLAHEFHKWTLDDANLGDILCVQCKNGIKFLVKYAGITDETHIKTFAWYRVDENDLEPKYFALFDITDTKISPATINEELTFMDALSERDMEWNSLKNCVMKAIR